MALLLVYFGMRLLMNRSKWYNFSRGFGLLGIVQVLILSWFGDFTFSEFSEPIRILLPQVGIYPDGVLPKVQTTGSEFSWLPILYVAYGLGVVFLSCRFANNLLAVWKIHRHSSSVASLGAYDLRVHQVEHGGAFSFLRSIYLPENMDRSGDEFEMTIRHEMVHLSLGHSYDVLFIEFLQVVFWFVPSIWLFAKPFRSLHEFQADSSVVRSFGKEKYGHFLIRSVHNQSRALVQPLDQLFIRQRIKKMTQRKSKLKSSIVLALSSVLFGAAILLSGCVHQVPDIDTVPPPPPPAPPAMEELAPPPPPAPPGDQGEIKLSPLEKQKTAQKKEHSSPKQDEILTKAEVMPIFPGCEKNGSAEDKASCTTSGIMNYIYQNLKYPTEAREAGIQGMVVMSFVVTKDGGVTDFEILRNPGGGCGEAVLSTMEKMQTDKLQWIPGRQDGKAVSVKYTLPVKFALE